MLKDWPGLQRKNRPCHQSDRDNILIPRYRNFGQSPSLVFKTKKIIISFLTTSFDICGLQHRLSVKMWDSILAVFLEIARNHKALFKFTPSSISWCSWIPLRANNSFSVSLRKSQQGNFIIDSPLKKPLVSSFSHCFCSFLNLFRCFFHSCSYGTTFQMSILMFVLFRAVCFFFAIPPKFSDQFHKATRFHHYHSIQKSVDAFQLFIVSQS